MTADEDAKNITILLHGDSGTGRTCLLIRYSSGIFPTQYIPTVCDNITLDDKTVDGQIVKVHLYDMANADEIDRPRPFSYPKVDAFILLFRVDCPPSLEHAESVWLPVIHKHCPESKIILVASQIDRRDDPAAVKECEEKYHRQIITPEEGMQTAYKIEAHGYMECSSLRNEGVNEVVEEAIGAVLQDKRPISSRGSLFERIRGFFSL